MKGLLYLLLLLALLVQERLKLCIGGRVGARLGRLQLLELVLGDGSAAFLLELFVFGQQLLLEVFVLSLRLLGIL